MENSKVNVVISKGTELVVIPKVVGKKQDEAESALKTAKLNVEIEEEISQKVEAGYIIKCEPSENSEVNAGDKVKLTVSKGTGIKKVAIPSVIGETEENAKKILTEAGLEVNVVNEEDRTKSSGEVLKQSLDVGKTVDEGTKIIITVNKLAEKKKATIIVNVKSITGGYEEKTETKAETKTETKTESANGTDKQSNTETTKTEKSEEEKINKTAKIRVEVDGEKIYNSDVDKNTTNLNVGEAIGTGTVTVKLFVDDVKKGEKDINLATTSSCVFD